jgi:AmiR/NasT family two-component response regulator
VILARQLSTALARRAVIDQAIGIMCARTGDATEEALAQLRAVSRTQNVTLVEVSQRIVDDAIAAADR